MLARDFLQIECGLPRRSGRQDPVGSFFYGNRTGGWGQTVPPEGGMERFSGEKQGVGWTGRETGNRAQRAE